MHLSPDTLRSLIDGSLPPSEARRLAAHLGAGCTTCEEVLADAPGADAADGRVDAALARLAAGAGDGRGRSSLEGHDIEFARIVRRTREGPPARPRRRAAWAGRWPLAAALLVVAAGAAVTTLTLRGGGPDAVWDGTKGPVAAPPVHLHLLVVTPGAPGSPAAVARAAPGEPVPERAALHFELEAGGPARAALFHLSAAGPVLLHSGPLEAGRTPLTVGGRPAGLPLAGLAGRQRFAVVAAEPGADPARLAQAASRIGPDASGTVTLTEGVSAEVVAVNVR